MNLKLIALMAGIAAVAVPCFAGAGPDMTPDLSKLPAASTKQGLTFDKDIKPLFEASCVGCHGERRANSGLRLDSLAAVLKGGQGRGGEVIQVVTPGKGETSQLLISVAKIGRAPMPPPPRGRGRGPGGPGGPGTTNAPAADASTNAAPARGPAAPKSLTPEEVGLVRAWIDQGAK